MAFEISQFQSALQYDGARSNLFEITLPFPSFAGPFAAVASQQITLMCHAASLPESSIPTFPVMFFGREVKLYGNRVYTDWQTSIYNDENFPVRNALEGWLNAINSGQGNLRSAAALSPSSYGVDAQVIQLGKTGNILASYNFVGLMPTLVSGIELSWSNNDSIEEFNVTWSYQYWTRTDVGIV